MTAKLDHLEIPIDTWEASDYVPNAAQEAVELNELLHEPVTKLDCLQIDSTGDMSVVDAVEIQTKLLLSATRTEFGVAAQVRLILRDDAANTISTISTRAVATWPMEEELDVLDDTAQTFALAFGCSEPLTLIAQRLPPWLAIYGVTSPPTLPDALRFNQVAVRQMAEMPPMDSPEASPLNPYALNQIDGADAEEWVSLDVPASSAHKWKDRGASARHARWWVEEGFSDDEAIGWMELHLTPIQAKRFIEQRYGCPEEVLDLADRLDVDPVTISEVIHCVSVDEIQDWLTALSYQTMIEAVDIPHLVKFGITFDQLEDYALSGFGGTANDLIVSFSDDPYADEGMY